MKLRLVLRSLARLAVTAIACTVVALIAVQYVRIVHRNVVYAQQVRDVEREIGDLQKRRDVQQSEIRRLSDPVGAIPEIHDRLHRLGDHEAIIYLKRHDGDPERGPDM